MKQLFIITVSLSFLFLSSYMICAKSYNSANPEDMKSMQKDLESGQFFMPPDAKISEGKDGRIEITQTVICDKATGKITNAPSFLPPEILAEMEKECQREANR